MNGCTFGVSGVHPDGSRRVSHSNNGGDTLSQRSATATLHGGLAGVTMLEPNMYRNVGGQNLQSTTFGIRHNGQWRFYYQVYDLLGFQQARLVGVFPVPGT